MRFKFKYTLSILFILLNAIAFSQTDECSSSLSGTMTTTSNDTLRFVRVYLKETKQGTTTDESGRFAIKEICNGRYVLMCKQFDQILLKDSIEITEDTSKDYRIETSVSEFETINIEGVFEKRETNVVNTLSKDKIDKVKGLPLGTMLEEINGVRTLKTGTSISKPIIHGLHSNRVLILNNGIRQGGQRWGSEHAPEIDPFVANEISLIKGANSIKYGFDAIGGVVLIKPRKISEEFGIRGEVNLVGFSNGRQGTSAAFIGGRHQKLAALSWSIQGSYKRGGNTHTPNYYLKNTGIQEYNFSGNLEWKKKNYGLDLYYSQFNSDLAIFSGSHIGNLTDLQHAFDLKEPAEKASFSYKIGRPWQHIEHELTKAKFFVRTGKIGKINLVYGRQYNMRYEYDKHKPLNDSLANLNTPELQLELTTHTVDVNWEHYKILGLKGEIGISGMYQKNTFSGRKFIPNFQNKGLGLYWVEKKQLNKVYIEAGVRYDMRFLQAFIWEEDNLVKPSHSYQDVAGNIGVNYRINDKWNLYANVSKTWRPPTINELYSSGVHHGAAAVENGDSTLNQENAWTTSLELSYTLKRIKFEVSPYFNYFSNYIFLNPELPPTLTIKGAFPTFDYKQAEVRISGLDFSTNVAITKNLKYTLKTSFLRAFNITANDYLIQMPADYYQNKISYEFPAFGRFSRNSVAIKYTHVTHQNRAPANSDFVSPPSAYDLFDVEVATKLAVNNQYISIHFGVNNIFSAVYRDYLNRFRYYADEMGRNFTIRIKIPIGLNTDK